MQHVLRLLETRDSFGLRNFRKRFRFPRSRSAATSAARPAGPRGPHPRWRAGAAAGPSEVGFDLRLRLEVERKRAIARAAAALVGEGEAVALDASTTAYYLALELRAKRELVVVTNGLLVATALADAPGITVLVTGGILRLSAMSLVGDLGTDVLRTTRINKGFLGARGLSLERGPDGSEPRRGADQAGDGRRLRAGLRDLRRHEVASQRAALVRPASASPASSPTRARRSTRSRRGARPGSTS